MSDSVDRDSVLDAFNTDLDKLVIGGEKNAKAVERYLNTVIDRIKSLPPAQPRGKWIRDGHHIRCDQCGMYMCDTDREGDRIPTEFCPHCGEKMEALYKP